MNKNLEFDITTSISRIKNLIGTGIFKEHSNVFFNSAYIEVLILLNNLLYHANDKKNRINFTDNIIIEEKYIEDVTDLIRYFRNAACHIDAEQRYNSHGGKLSFCLKTSPSETRFIFGGKELYLNAHIIRAFDEVVRFFEKDELSTPHSNS